MKKIFTIVFLAVFYLFLVPAFPASADEVYQVPVPRINKIDFIDSLVFLEGINFGNTEVLIYLNGTFNGLAEQSRDEQEFFYNFQPEPAGVEIEIMAIARDKTSLVLSAPIIYNYNLFREADQKLPPIPTMISPNIKTISANPKELIIGLSQSGTRVHVYIDGVYNGKTDFLENESITANFAYRPFLNLEPGKHYFQVMTENLNGGKSKISEKIFFTIEYPMPAPTLLKLKSDGDKIIVSGLTKNDSKVKIFLNKELTEAIEVKNHPSGTANFSVALTSSADDILIFATVEDARGKESRWSNFLNINFPPRQPKISPVAALEINEEISREEPLVLSSEQEFTDETGKIFNISEEDEKNDKKSSFFSKIIRNLNYIISLSFLAGVLIFAYFVKKGLKKEEK